MTNILQGDLDFDSEEQEEHLERVASRMDPAILDFCRARRRFHTEELRRWVVAKTGTAAPASADRILRSLRQRKRINYRVVSRRESLYEVLWVEGDDDERTPV